MELAHHPAIEDQVRDCEAQIAWHARPRLHRCAKQCGRHARASQIAIVADHQTKSSAERMPTLPLPMSSARFSNASEVAALKLLVGCCYYCTAIARGARQHARARALPNRNSG